MFKWPWISRRLHEELTAELRSQNGKLEDENKRLKDVIHLHEFGYQIYGTLPVPKPAEPEKDKPGSEYDDNPITQAKIEAGRGASARSVITLAQRNVNSEYARDYDAEAKAAIEAAKEKGRATAKSAVN